MASTFTPNKNLEKPAAGDYNDTWATPVNADWTAIDNAFGGHSSIVVTGVGTGTYSLTLVQYQPPNIIFSGTLGAALVYQFPSGVGGIWSFYNNTTGANTITIKSVGGGSSVVLPQGSRTLVVCDATNVQLADTGALGANPTASAGLAAVNGSAATFLRSDGAPAISQAIVPTWTGAHTFSAAVTHNGTVALNNTVTLGAAKTINAATGIVNVATQTTGNNTALAANTAFVQAQLASTLAAYATQAYANGTLSGTAAKWSMNFPGSFLINGGYYAAASPITATFETAFTTACYGVLAMANQSGAGDPSTSVALGVGSISKTGCVLWGGGGGAGNIFYLAVGS